MRDVAAYGWLSALIALPSAHGACPGDDTATAYGQVFHSAALSPGFGNGLSLQDALCSQGNLVRRLTASLGPGVGYKVGRL